MKFKFLLVIIAFSLIGIQSCKDEKDCADWVEDSADESAALSSALSAFTSNSSTATCNAYKAAAHDYVDALRSAEDCVDGATQQQWESLVDLYEAIDTIDCTVYGAGTCNWVLEVQTEITQRATAQAAHGNDPSTANCNAYKTALQNYINALQELLDNNFCTDGSQDEQDIEDARDAAQANYDALTC